MNSLSFPDVNVWLALLLADHVHRQTAAKWFRADESDVIAFVRFTQVAVLRLLTTASVMGNKPLSMRGAWDAYHRLFEDDRVAFVAPKLWADAYLAAIAEESAAKLITFDRALARRCKNSVLLG